MHSTLPSEFTQAFIYTSAIFSFACSYLKIRKLMVHMQIFMEDCFL